MQVCGIVAEYNPFHNGHLFHLEQAKKATQADIVIAVMSGNFTQRGEFAILDKWTRTEVALQHGIDIVVELPTVHVLQSADYFGLESVKLLQQLGCTALAFGVENKTRLELESLTQQLVESQSLVASSFQQTEQNQSYGKRFEEALILSLGEKTTQNLLLPNNVLALSYVKALKELNSTMEIFPILRQTSRHGETTLLENETVASGSSIRHALQKSKSIHSYVSEIMAERLNHSVFVNNEKLFMLLKAKILTTSTEALQKIAHVDEGIEYRLKKYVTQVNSYEEFVQVIQSKRWRLARVERMFLAIILGLTKEIVKDSRAIINPPVRLLGFSKKGRMYLNQLKAIQKISNLRKNDLQTVLFQFQVQADEMYRLLQDGTLNEQNITRYPIQWNEVLYEKK